MLFTLAAEIKGKIDSRKLYEETKIYGVNVIDMEKVTYIYTSSEIDLRTVGRIQSACEKYGKCDFEIKSV